MNTTDWFIYQLKASGEGLAWAVQQVLPERHTITPPAMSEWSVARHIFHLLHYEQYRALPYLHHWLGGPAPDTSQLNENQDWETHDQTLSTNQLLQEFQHLRATQLTLLRRFTESDWLTVRDIGIPATLQWVVTKTYQHTLDHTNTILCLALFWDFS
ncbi:MAG: DinB family protein [Ktedonobacteraceae bacterium]|nr:DinB family protein [Ktedonobacteraceae bacterium]